MFIAATMPKRIRNLNEPDPDQTWWQFAAGSIRTQVIGQPWTSIGFITVILAFAWAFISQDRQLSGPLVVISFGLLIWAIVFDAHRSGVSQRTNWLPRVHRDQQPVRFFWKQRLEAALGLLMIALGVYFWAKP
jgi:hypothetical protein